VALIVATVCFAGRFFVGVEVDCVVVNQGWQTSLHDIGTRKRDKKETELNSLILFMMFL
jgi:hypothetical protein